MAINYYQLQTMIICGQVTTLYLGVFLNEILLDIYQRLFRQYGPQYWWPGDGPFEIALGAILTQGTSWSNAEKALGNKVAAIDAFEKAKKDKNWRKSAQYELDMLNKGL